MRAYSGRGEACNIPLTISRCVSIQAGDKNKAPMAFRASCGSAEGLVHSASTSAVRGMPCALPGVVAPSTSAPRRCCRLSHNFAKRGYYASEDVKGADVCQNNGEHILFFIS